MDASCLCMQQKDKHVLVCKIFIHLLFISPNRVFSSKSTTKSQKIAEFRDGGAPAHLGRSRGVRIAKLRVCRHHVQLPQPGPLPYTRTTSTQRWAAGQPHFVRVQFVRSWSEFDPLSSATARHPPVRNSRSTGLAGLLMTPASPGGGVGTHSSQSDTRYFRHRP